mgnify:CR=1 FL=1
MSEQQLLEHVMMAPSNTDMTAEFVDVNGVEEVASCHAGCSGNCHP